MASGRDRQRAAARARLEREMAARAEAAQRKKRRQARIGVGAGGTLALLLIVWLVVVLTGGNGKPATAADAVASGDASCQWLPLIGPETTPLQTLPEGIQNVGTPPTKVSNSGTQIMTIDTNLGTIKVQMDDAKTPCTAASFTYLASKNFFKNAPCHRMADSISILQCGDPSGKGTGGPAYRFANENLPKSTPAYHEGDVAMANSDRPGQPSGNTNGSQFFFVYGDTSLPANYTLFGKVIQGMDIIKKVAAAGDDGAYAQQAGGGHPKLAITFKSVTVSAPSGGATNQPSAGTSGTPSSDVTSTPSPASASPNPSS